MSLLDGVTLAALLVGLPVLAVAQARALRGVEISRMPAYASSAATLVLLAGWCAVVGLHGRAPAALGLSSMPVGGLLSWTAVVTLAGCVLLLGFRLLGSAFGVEESHLLHQLLPRTRGERAAFAGLSLVAGVGEEVVYRGYALAALAPAVGILGAGVLTSLAFGVLHAYQGPLGMVRTAALGGLLASAYLAAGSLGPVVLAHALIDLLGGIVLAERFMSPGKRETGDSAGVP